MKVTAQEYFANVNAIRYATLLDQYRLMESATKRIADESRCAGPRSLLSEFIEQVNYQTKLLVADAAAIGEKKVEHYAASVTVSD